MKVLVTDKFSAEGLRVFEEAEGIELSYCPGISGDDLLREVATAEALVVRSGTAVTQEILSHGTALKVVGRAGLGVENIDMDTANRQGVVVMNTPFGTTTTSAEHTLAMLLALARKIPQANASTRQGKWETERFQGVEIAGKTLGVVGAGKVGRLVAEMAQHLKMRVLVFDPYLSDEAVRLMGAEQVKLDRLLARSDFITFHIPLNKDTQYILDEEAIGKLKSGCRIINCAKGGLIDEAALASAIAKGHVAGAALDVFEAEPPSGDNPLLGLEQVICTPHIRTATIDAQTNVALQLANQVVDFLQKGIVANAINVPSMHAELLAQLRPYLDLSEKLGLFQAQIYARGLESVTVEYSGALAELPARPLTTALVKGLLTPIMGSNVNYVNALQLARERGIRVIEAKSDSSEGFANLIRLSVTGSEGVHSVCGALFARDDYRIVHVDDYHVEAIPEGHILVLNNADRAGVIGFVGQVLAEARVNIAMMNLSRRKIKGRAISLISVDSKIPEIVLEKLRNNEHILSAIQVQL